MRILYVSDSNFPSQSANSVHVIKMCEAFAKNGHEVMMTGLATSNMTADQIAEYYGVSKNFQFSLSHFPRVKGVLWLHGLKSLWVCKKFKPNLIFGRSYLSASLLGIVFSKIRLAFETHSPYSSLNLVQRWAFNHILHRSVLIVVISKALQQILKLELSAQYSVSNIRVHHDGATIRPVNKAHEIPQFDTGNSCSIGYLGSFQSGRGIELLIALSHELPEVDFHLIGGNLDSLRAITLEEAIPPNVILHGFISPNSTIDYLSRLDILAAPYQTNTKIKSGTNTSAYMSPLKIFEYMAAKKPIIASDLPVIREVLNSENSILVPPDDVMAWKGAITRLKDPNLRALLSNQAFNDLQSKYSWSLRAKSILQQV